MDGKERKEEGKTSFAVKNEWKVRILGAGIGYDAVGILLRPVIIWWNLGVCIIMCDTGTVLSLGRWRIMIMCQPKPEMLQDSLDNMGKFNKGDNPHLTLAFGVDQGINFINFLGIRGTSMISIVKILFAL